MDSADVLAASMKPLVRLVTAAMSLIDLKTVATPTKDAVSLVRDLRKRYDNRVLERITSLSAYRPLAFTAGLLAAMLGNPQDTAKQHRMMLHLIGREHETRMDKTLELTPEKLAEYMTHKKDCILALSSGCASLRDELAVKGISLASPGGRRAWRIMVSNLLVPQQATLLGSIINILDTTNPAVANGFWKDVKEATGLTTKKELDLSDLAAAEKDLWEKDPVAFRNTPAYKNFERLLNAIYETASFKSMSERIGDTTMWLPAVEQAILLENIPEQTREAALSKIQSMPTEVLDHFNSPIATRLAA